MPASPQMRGRRSLLNNGYPEIKPIAPGFVKFTLKSARGTVTLPASVTVVNLNPTIDSIAACRFAILKYTYAQSGRLAPQEFQTVGTPWPMPTSFTYTVLNVPAYLSYGPVQSPIVAPLVPVSVEVWNGSKPIATDIQRVALKEGASNTVTLSPHS